MWRVSVRDLLWRRRRFLIAVAATSLVFSITLLLSGVSYSVRQEAVRIVDVVGADAWLVPPGASGPFTSTDAIPGSEVDRVADRPGVDAAHPLVFFRGSVAVPSLKDVNVIGYEPGGLGTPPVDEGRALEGDGEVVADAALGLDVGDRLELAGLDLEVVGVADGVSFTFGLPTLFITVDDGREAVFGGEPIVTAVLTEGRPDAPVAGLVTLTADDVVSDIRRPIAKGTGIIDFVNVLLWIIAGGIVGSLVYLSALERTRDVAVLKATGASTWSLLSGLLLQGLALSGTAAVVAVAFALVLSGGLPVESEITAVAYVRLAVIAVALGVIASGAGLRRAVAVDPALAFGGK